DYRSDLASIFFLGILEIRVVAHHVRCGDGAITQTNTVKCRVEITGRVNVPLLADRTSGSEEGSTQTDQARPFRFEPAQPHFVLHISAFAGDLAIAADEAIFTGYGAHFVVGK